MNLKNLFDKARLQKQVIAESRLRKYLKENCIDKELAAYAILESRQSGQNEFAFIIIFENGREKTAYSFVKGVRVRTKTALDFIKNVKLRKKISNEKEIKKLALLESA